MRHSTSSEDVYFKKVVPFNFSRQSLKFKVSQDLFSSHDVDVGTKFLLRTIVTDAGARNSARILDLGCGYGPIGLTLKKMSPERVVHLTDRDALAVDYVRQNADLNELAEGTETYGSVGYDDVQQSDFDLIVSNIPGKAGTPVISSLLLDARSFLAPGGLVAIVVVSPLEQMVADLLDATSEVGVVLRQARAGHTVFHYEFVEPFSAPAPEWRSGMERGVYWRTTSEISRFGVDYRLQTAFGMPEFESPNYATDLLIEGVQSVGLSNATRAVVFNPGQGHVPVMLWKLVRPAAIVLVDRDLLALRYSRLNLAANDAPGDAVTVVHQVGILPPDRKPADLVAGVIREDEGQAALALTIAQAAEQIAPGGTALFTGSSTAVTRSVALLETYGHLEIVARKRRHGNSLLMVKAVGART